MEFEGSGSSSGAEKRISHGRNNCPAGLKNRGKRKVWAPWGLPGPSATYAPSPARPPGPSQPGSRAPTGALATYRANLLVQIVLYTNGQ